MHNLLDHHASFLFAYESAKNPWDVHVTSLCCIFFAIAFRSTVDHFHVDVWRLMINMFLKRLLFTRIYFEISLRSDKHDCPATTGLAFERWKTGWPVGGNRSCVCEASIKDCAESSRPPCLPGILLFWLCYFFSHMKVQRTLEMSMWLVYAACLFHDGIFFMWMSGA